MRPRRRYLYRVTFADRDESWASRCYQSLAAAQYRACKLSRENPGRLYQVERSDQILFPGDVRDEYLDGERV